MTSSVRLAMCAAVFALSATGSAAAAAPFSAHGSVEQVYATGLPAGAKATLLNGSGHKVATKKADALGGLLFRNVKPGAGYRVSQGGAQSDPLTVFSTQSAPPSTDVYNQTIPSDGYGYLTTRDGTKLAYSVHPPQDITNAEGIDLPPLPTGDSTPSPPVVEYSGYGYAKPDGPVSGIAALANL